MLIVDRVEGDGYDSEEIEDEGVLVICDELAFFYKPS
jgi:hypothetical protein